VRRVISSFITTTTHDGSPQDDANRPTLWLGPNDNACKPNADASLPPNGEPHDEKYQPTANKVTLNNNAASTLGWESDDEKQWWPRWAQRQRVELHRGLGNPSAICRTTRDSELTANVLNDTKAQQAHCRCVERCRALACPPPMCRQHAGTGPNPAVSKDAVGQGLQQPSALDLLRRPLHISTPRSPLCQPPGYVCHAPPLNLTTMHRTTPRQRPPASASVDPPS